MADTVLYTTYGTFKCSAIADLGLTFFNLYRILWMCKKRKSVIPVSSVHILSTLEEHGHCRVYVLESREVLG